ncbi:uncharacterized protein LOC142224165 [Haematobia irritans]|uniref:uncharacterized protein LOC142224165 n=1 Tax=Haematobia irritans TaxID=7368 RepID=UPI003F502154
MFLKILIFLIFCANYVRSECEGNELKTKNGSCLVPVSMMDCDDQNCSENMECNNASKKCQCKKGFFEYYDKDTNRTSCTFPLPLRCEEDNDCGPYAACNGNEGCQCSKGYEMKIFGSNESMVCDKSEIKCPLDYIQCATECCSPDGLCVEGQCICNEGYFRIDDEGHMAECLKNDLNLHCFSGYTLCSGLVCCGKNSQCSSDQCVCEEGFRRNVSEYKYHVDCVAIINESLVEEEMIQVLECDDGRAHCSGLCCPEHSHCIEGTKCECLEGFQEKFYQKLNMTLCEALENDDIPFEIKDAADNTECHLGNSECGPNQQCLEGKCLCKPGYEMKFNATTNSSQCEAIQQCPNEYFSCMDMCCGPHAQCLEGQCLCLKGFMEMKTSGHNLVTCDQEPSFLGIFEFYETAYNSAAPNIEDFCLDPHQHCSAICCGENAACNTNSKCQCISEDFEKIQNITTKAIACISKPPDLCLDPQVTCNKFCCGSNAYCNEHKACVCTHSHFLEKYTLITKAKSCEPRILKSENREPYIVIGVLCISFAILALCIKIIQFCKSN